MPTLELRPLSGRYLTFVEREQIALLRVQGLSVRAIARRIDRQASTVSRELRRNAATRGGYIDYRATTAQWHAQRRVKRPKPAKLFGNKALCQYVQDRLCGAVVTHAGQRLEPQVAAWNGRRHGRREDRRWAVAWSPQQIANRLLIDFPNDISMRASHEAIYQALYIRGRGALQRDLTACLRTGRALRMPRARGRGRGKQFVTADLTLQNRPGEVAGRDVLGHWEGDLILGLGSSSIGTLVERASRYSILLHLPRLQGHGDRRKKNGPALAGHGAVRESIAAALEPLPRALRKTLTWDQGAEMAQHVALRRETGLQVYFCDPRSPWQRGANENTNGLLRQYFPKGTDLCRYGADEFLAVSAALNNRPRRILG